MIGSGRRVTVFASTRPTDMRKSFDTLSYLVTAELGQDPMSGDVFLFVNSRRTRAKALLWDGTGLCIYSKCLEMGRFAAPWQRAKDGIVKMTTSELTLFFEGSQLVLMGALSPDEVEPKRVATKSLAVRNVARIDLDRVSDLELLRQVAKIQDAEIRRLQDKLMTVTRQLAEAAGDVSAIEAQLRLLQKEFDERIDARAPKGESGARVRRRRRRELRKEDTVRPSSQTSRSSRSFTSTIRLT